MENNLELDTQGMYGIKMEFAQLLPVQEMVVEELHLLSNSV